MQSYYGSSPTAKRFEVTQRQGELHLPKGIVSTWNGKILRGSGGQEDEESFGGAAEVELSDGVKIARTGSQQHRQSKRGFETLTNPAEYYFLGFPIVQKGQQRDVAFEIPQAEKSSQRLGHIQSGDLLAGFALGVKFNFSFSHAHGRRWRLAFGGHLLQYLHGSCTALPDVRIVEGMGFEQ